MDRVRAAARTRREVSRAVISKTGGFTLIEVLTVTALIAVIATFAMPAYRNYARASDHRGAVRETVAVLRNAQVRAVSESSTHECRFTASEVSIYDAAGLRTRVYRLPTNLQYVASGSSHGAVHGFSHSATSGNSNCFFYARGTASEGTVGLKRGDNAAEYDLKLEALTSRVSYCADPTPANPC
ncbi:MAG: pilus assembly FimT family protein [Actinomycetota bacterium]